MSASSSLSLKEYLKRYQSTTDEPKKTQRKKPKSKPDSISTSSRVLVLDNDPIWQKPLPPEDVEEEDNVAGDETPQVEEDIEVKRMKRLEALRALKPYHGINEDGSGWVSIPNKDLSPPRRRPRLDTPSPENPLSGSGGDSGDLSPPRRRNLDDLSPQRKPGKGLVEDFSPRRDRSLHAADDLSPPRRDSKPDRLRSGIEDSMLNKEAKRGGILSAKEMREETDRKRKEEKSRFAAMDPLLTGRGVEAVYRDKEGKRISKEELMKSKEKKKEEKPLEWGKGLAQKREAEERGKELELEKERPFTRTRDDPELEKMLKERLRWGDPMAHLVKGKTSELILEDLSTNEKMKESGFIVPQTIPTHSWLKRGLDCPPNRYGIRPGRHWDGVDRSNGYEKELFKRQNEKRATETEAYLWSVSDM